MVTGGWGSGPPSREVPLKSRRPFPEDLNASEAPSPPRCNKASQEGSTAPPAHGEGPRRGPRALAGSRTPILTGASVLAVLVAHQDADQTARDPLPNSSALATVGSHHGPLGATFLRKCSPGQKAAGARIPSQRRAG